MVHQTGQFLRGYGHYIEDFVVYLTKDNELRFQLFDEKADLSRVKKNIQCLRW